MAVLVGLLVGFVARVLRPRAPIALLLVLPLAAAAIEIVVNTARFGVAPMVIWSPILVVLTVGATVVAGGLGVRVQRRAAS